MKNPFKSAFISVIVFSSSSLSHADTYEWNGETTGGATGVSDTWDTVTENWSDFGTIWPAAPTLDDDAVFGGIAGTVSINSPVVANDITFNTAGYKIQGQTLFLAGTTPTITNTVTAEISAIMGGSGGFTKRAAGILVISGPNNTLGGNVIAGIAQNTDPAPSVVNDGILRLADNKAAGNGTLVVNGGHQRGRVELAGGVTLSNAITLQGRQGFSYSAITNNGGDNTLSGTINVQANGSRLIFNSSAGKFTVSGAAMTGSSGRALTFRGAAFGVFAKNITSAVVGSMDKFDAGTWVLSGSNSHTGANSVTGGSLIVKKASGLGTGNVSTSAGATLNYAADADSPLTIGGTLTVNGGTNSAIGGAIGSTVTSAAINVTGAATITNAAHNVNIFGIPGVTPTTGTYTLVNGGVGSVLNPATPPTLGKVYNNTNFTVGALSASSTKLEVGITPATALTTAYWDGGLSGATNVWSVSNGSTASNWLASDGGLPQPLVPGAGTAVVISTSSPTAAPLTTLLGADMSIERLTIADTTNGLGLNAEAYSLTISPTDPTAGITMASDVPASTIAAAVVLGQAQTWTNHSGDALTVSGSISGANSIIKEGTGTLVLSGNNSYTGTTRVANGTLEIGSVNALATTTLDMNNLDTGSVSFVKPGTNTYNVGALTGGRSLDAGGNSLSIGGSNLSGEFTGILGNASLTKVGTGDLTLSGNNEFTGNVTHLAGEISLTHSNALGVGPKTLYMQGGSRKLFLSNNITLPSNITIVASSNSFDGGGITNESGNNTIQGLINIDTGNPALNISSAAGTLSIAGNVTLTATARPLLLGGASTGDNTISGVIGSSSSEALTVTKQGAGKWILTNNNTYTGTTTITGGTLLVNGSIAEDSAVDLTGGTLGGNGSVNGPVTVSASGTVAPGTSTGALTVGSADFSTGGTLAIEINDSATPKVDVLNVTGNLDVTNASLNISAIGSPGQSTYVIATAASINGTFPPANVTGLPDGYSLEYTATEIKLTGSPTNTYASWLTANAPATGFVTDSDNDGVANGLENVLGTNPNVYSAGLTNVSATASSATYSHTLNPTIASDVSYSYQWSTDLVEWKASGESNTNGTTATITPSAPVAGVVTVTTSITAGPATKVFTRIMATQP